MSVLIKGMEMPNNCEVCPYAFCHLDTNNCPLVEVPTTHGRLIDADRLTERFENLSAQALDYVGKLIEQDDDDNVQWRIWSTIWAERTAYTHDLYDAPTIIAKEE